MLWKKYREMWDKAEMPRRGDFGGVYDISLKIAPRWKDRKVLSYTEGYNVSKAGRWGYLMIDAFDQYAVFSYNDPRNGFFTRRFVDHVREGIGWFGIRFLWWWIPICPFTMEWSGEHE